MLHAGGRFEDEGPLEEPPLNSMVSGEFEEFVDEEFEFDETMCEMKFDAGTWFGW